MTNLINQIVYGYKFLQKFEEDEATEYWYAENPEGAKSVIRILKPEFSKSAEAVKDFINELKLIQSESTLPESESVILDYLGDSPCAIVRFVEKTELKNSELSDNSGVVDLEMAINSLKPKNFKSKMKVPDKEIPKSAVRRSGSFAETFEVFKNKKLVLLFAVFTIFVIIITAIITINVGKGNMNNEYMAIINEDLDYSVAILEDKSNSLYARIEAKGFEQPAKYSALGNQAHDIESSCDELLIMIDDLKSEIIIECGGLDKNYTQAMEDKNDSKSALKVLNSDKNFENFVEKFEDYRNLLLGYIGDTSSMSYKVVDWNLYYLNSFVNHTNSDNPDKVFKDIPSIGVVNLLTQLQIKILLSEVETITNMLNNLEGLDVRITSLEGVVSAPRNILNLGDVYIAQIGMMAKDTFMNPTVFYSFNEPFYDSTIMFENQLWYILNSDIDYDTVFPNENGECFIKKQCNKPGKYKYGGLIRYYSNRGDMWLPFVGEYQVK